MKKAYPIVILVLCVAFVGCQKQQTDEERRAEVEREVQQRLAAERQQEQARQLDQRQAELNAREQSVNENEKRAAEAPRRETSPSERRVTRETTIRRDREPTGSYSIFYTKLEPYGDWLETRDYGYVYRPREAANGHWRPYVNGRWVYTDAGWTWISDEPFGWATYHYGRWTRIRGAGWVWVPGDEWAPAWVSWRKGGDYVGWAPLPPEAQFDRRSGIHNWSDSYYDVGPDQYVFIPSQRFGEQRIERAIVPEQRNLTIINQTTNVTSITYNNTTIVNQGPSYDELKGQSQVPIQRLRLERQVNAQVNDGQPVVRGDVVELPAPALGTAQAAERPRTVKQTIGTTTVDLGWGAINNPREAEQARAKMKSEATPPPDAPPKKFVRASEASAAAATPTVSETPSVAPRSTEKPTAIPQPTFTARATASVTATPLPSATTAPVSTVTPPANATVSTPVPEASTPVLNRPTVSPTAAPNAPSSVRKTTTGSEASVTPANAASPALSTSTDDQRKKLKSAARQFEKRAIVPMPSASISPEMLASPAEKSVPSPAPEKARQNAFPLQPATTPAPTTSPSATNELSPADSGAKKERRNHNRARGNQGEPSPAASPSTAPQQ
ncbi:MAG: hypothetical protein QOH24_2242 [Verrucomicrobiota bacterium]|jgi:hypothetical protein